MHNFFDTTVLDEVELEAEQDHAFSDAVSGCRATLEASDGVIGGDADEAVSTNQSPRQNLFAITSQSEK